MEYLKINEDATIKRLELFAKFHGIIYKNFAYNVHHSDDVFYALMKITNNTQKASVILFDLIDDGLVEKVEL